MALYRILEYLDVSNRNPFKDWFDSLDAQAAAKISVALTRLANGNISNVKGVGGGVLKVRVDFGPGYQSISAGTVTNSSFCWAAEPSAVNNRT